jgi:hypothetical protein
MALKFCRNCRWSYHWHVSGVTVAWLCRHPSAATTSTDFVTGEVRTSARPCKIHRRRGECGKEGKLWEAKTPDMDTPPVGSVD